MSCRALTGDKMAITPDGFVYPCVAFKSLEFPCKFNNVKKNSLKVIMDSWKVLLLLMLPEEAFQSTCTECTAQKILKELKEGEK